MTAKLFLAARAIKAFIGFGREALGVQSVGDLPPQQQRHGASEQAVGIPVWDKNKRREHHRKIPVIDTAGGAAAIFHKPGLERAEEQNTDDIAD